MTDSENSIVHDDSDEDIYKDVSEFNFDQELAKAETSRQQYQEEIGSLTEKVKALSQENENLKNLNTTLEKNLSILLKTAQAEVKRKDTVIDELRVQIDSFAFKRKNNKLTKEQGTNTEEWDLLVNSNSRNKDFKCDRDIKSFKGENNKDRDRKSLKNENRNSRYENSGCDSIRKSSYSCKESEQVSETNSERNSNIVGNKFKENSYFLRERNESNSPLHKKDRRGHSKHSPDGYKRHSRRSEDFRYSPHSERGMRKRSLRNKSPDDRYMRNSKRRRSRSPPRSRQRKSKEESPQKERNSRTTLEYFKNKKLHRAKSNERDSNSIISSSRKSRSSSQEKAKDHCKNDKPDPKSTKSDKTLIQSQERKFLLDGLHKEDVVNVRHSSYTTKPDSGIASASEELEEGECVDTFDDINTSLVNQEKEDWKLSFKNERPNDSKPMTLYSKRMMKKLSVNLPVEKNEKKKRDIPELKSLEKEPGELTDDESLIEKTEDFQKVAKAAVLESNIVNNPLVIAGEKPDSNSEFINKDSIFQTTEKDISTIKPKKKEKNVTVESSSTKFNDFQAPLPVVKKTNSEKLPEASKDHREVIEFSPFKNNYKLIKISPVQVPKSVHYSNSCNPKLSSSPSKQKKVEKSIFNLLSRLSGVQVDPCEGEPVEKLKSENNSIETPEVAICQTPNSVPLDANNGKKKETNKESTKSVEEKGKSELEKNMNDKTSKKKTISIENYLSKKKGKRENVKETLSPENKKNDKNDVDPQEKEIISEDASPGETTQFLNFFLLTTSPSKPILPAEEEKLLKKSQGKRESDLPKEKSESDITPSTSDTSDIKEYDEDDTKNVKNVSKRKKSKSCVSKENSASKNSGKETKENEIKGEIEITPKKIENLLENSSINSRVIGEIGQENIKKKRKISEREISDHSEEYDKPKIAKRENLKKGKRVVESDTKSEEQERFSEDDTKVKEDISFFEFFKPIVKKDERLEKEVQDVSNPGDFKMTTTMSLTGVVRLETPNKCMEKLKNVMINEQTIYQVLEPKNDLTYSPLIGAKMVEMTPRRMLKNDLMLTDSEDDSGIKHHQTIDEEEDEKEENVEVSPSENSDCESDSGASDFVDQL